MSDTPNSISFEALQQFAAAAPIGASVANAVDLVQICYELDKQMTSMLNELESLKLVAIDQQRQMYLAAAITRLKQARGAVSRVVAA